MPGKILCLAVWAQQIAIVVTHEIPGIDQAKLACMETNRSWVPLPKFACHVVDGVMGTGTPYVGILILIPVDTKASEKNEVTVNKKTSSKSCSVGMCREF